MCKNISRSDRRYQRSRLKKKRCNYWGFGKYGYRSYCEDSTNEMSKKQLGYVVNTPTPCSCWMCGNPRRNVWSKKECLTIQERKALEDYNYNMEEIDGS